MKIFVYLLGVLAVVFCAADAIKNRNEFLKKYEVFRRFRWWQIPLGFLTVAFAVECSYLLSNLVPFFNYGNMPLTNQRKSHVVFNKLNER